jgi:3-oxoadipate enol-lactonase
MLVTTDDGVRLYVIAGTDNGVPLVLSNSLGTDTGLWSAQADALAGSRSVWRYDTRGHGQSDAPAAEYSLDRLGKDLLAVIDATGADRADVCGISIGGMTALWAAVHAPHRLRRVILANTAARIGNDRLWAERIRGARTDGMGVLADASMARWFTEGFRARHPDVVACLRKTFEATSVGGYVGCCAALRDADLRPVAEKVACPALIVTGRHDPATPPADGQWLGDQIRGARVVDLDAAHLSNVERADEFNVAVRDFISAD